MGLWGDGEIKGWLWAHTGPFSLGAVISLGMAVGLGRVATGP